jgi:TRAP-type uncharacterized transport system fused permease subunit
MATPAQFLKGMYNGTTKMAPITIVLAHLGIIITIMDVTAMGNRLALILVTIADINIIVFIAALTGIIILLGMGMPAIAGYLIPATIAVPALVELGFSEPASHFFVFYVAILSNITPPVALACAVTSNIADADFMETSISSLKVGVAGYILPYVILFNPLLIDWSFPDTFVVAIATFFGIMLIVIGLQKQWTKSRELNTGHRIGSTLVGLALIFFALGVV